MGNSYIDQAYKTIYQHKDWKKEAKDYEEYLAAKLFNSTYTKHAAKTALTRISNILTTYYTERSQKSLPQKQLQDISAVNDAVGMAAGADEKVTINMTLVDALMQSRKDNTGAGQIGKVMKGDERADGTQFTQEQADLRNMQKLDEVINGDGNLREQMTLLYNGMFINGGTSKDAISKGVSFKGVVQGVKNLDDGDKKAALGLDYGLLDGLSQYQEGKDVFDTFSLARDLERRSEKIQGKGNRVTRWWRGIKRALDAALLNTFRRSGRSKSEQQGLGLEHYEKLGIAPSARERAYAMTVDQKDNKKQIAWKEGTAYYKAKNESTAEGMLQTAGTSGTTLRMLGAYRLMGASQKELLDFRLALIAWMVTSHDHSLYEILRGSHNAGVKGTENLREAATMYMNIDPLDTRLLREHFTRNGEFPHEIVYKEMLNEVTEAREQKEKEAMSPEEYEKKMNARIENDAQMRKFATLVHLYNEKQAELKNIPDEIRNAEKILEYMAEHNITDESQKKWKDYKDQMLEYKEWLEDGLPDIKKKCEEMLTKINTDRDQLHLTLHQYEGSQNINLVGADARGLNAQTLALNIYTSGAYQSMNTSQKWGFIAGKKQLEQIENTETGGQEGFHLADKNEIRDFTMTQKIYKAVQVSARMAQDALAEREDKAGTEAEQKPMRRTFRGEKGDGSKYHGKYVTNAMTSTSSNFEEALEFYKGQAIKHGYDQAVLVMYQLPEDVGADISRESAYSYEQEVLIPRDTEFEVSGNLKKHVPIEKIRKNTKGEYEDYQEDAPENVTDEKLRAELIPKKVEKPAEDGQPAKTEYETVLEHVNIIQLTAVNGASRRRREARRGGDEARRQIRASIEEDKKKEAAEKAAANG